MFKDVYINRDKAGVSWFQVSGVEDLFDSTDDTLKEYNGKYGMSKDAEKLLNATSGLLYDSRVESDGKNSIYQGIFESIPHRRAAIMSVLNMIQVDTTYEGWVVNDENDLTVLTHKLTGIRVSFDYSSVYSGSICINDIELNYHEEHIAQEICKEYYNMVAAGFSEGSKLEALENLILSTGETL